MRAGRTKLFARNAEIIETGIVEQEHDKVRPRAKVRVIKPLERRVRLDVGGRRLPR